MIFIIEFTAIKCNTIQEHGDHILSCTTSMANLIAHTVTKCAAHQGDEYRCSMIKLFLPTFL